MIPIQYVGHASWLIGDRFRILCDPWLNRHGVFFSSWFQFPANDHLDLEPLKSADLIYLSHTHEDHFDPWFLEQVDRQTPILSARFDSDDLRDRVADLGFENLIELEDGEYREFDDLRVTTFRDEDHGMYFDSALLVERDGVRVLNLNDCRLDEAVAASLGEAGGVAALLKFYSGASAYPLAYEYDEAKMRRLCAEKRSRSLASLETYAALTQARVTVPCSGPAAFLDESLFHLNDLQRRDDNPFPNMATAVDYLRDKGVATELVMPGDVWQVDATGMRLADRTLQPGEVYDDVGAYLKSYAERRRPLIDEQLAVLESRDRDPSSLLAQRLEEISASRCFLKRIDLDILWEFTGNHPARLWMRLQSDQPPRLEPYVDQPIQYRYTLDSKFAVEILSRPRVDWEDFFLSLRFRAWRDPDRFNYFFYSLLKHLDRPRLQAAEYAYLAEEQRSEMMDLEVNGRRLRVQRYCPHQGTDLQEVGQLEDNVLVCPRHGWKFCLETGACLNVEGESIRIEPDG